MKDFKKYMLRNPSSVLRTLRRLSVPALLVVVIGCHQAEADRATSAYDQKQDGFDVRLIDDEEAGAFRLVIGPVDIPAAEGGGHHHHGVLPTPKTVQFPKSVHLTGFQYAVVDENGEELPTGVLHHMNVIKPEYRELFLPISQRMLALGRETGPQSLPAFLFGHPIDAGTDVVVSAMLHNPIGPELKGVTIEVTLEYVEGEMPWPLWEIYPFQLDVRFPAGEKAFDLPPGPSEVSYEGRPVLKGRIVAMGAHLHNHAERIRFEDITAGETIWEGYPMTNGEGDVTGVTVGRLYKQLGTKVYRDHLYRVTVRYNNPTPDTLVAGGMGVVAGAFIPSTDEVWPRADETHLLYRMDRMHYMREVSGTYDELLAFVTSDSSMDGMQGSNPDGAAGHEGMHGSNPSGTAGEDAAPASNPGGTHDHH